MDRPRAHRDHARAQRREPALGGTGYDAHHEGAEAPGDEGREEVLRSGGAVGGDAEVEPRVWAHAWGERVDEFGGVGVYGLVWVFAGGEVAVGEGEGGWSGVFLEG